MTNTPYSRGDSLRFAQTLVEDDRDEDIALNHPMFNLSDERSVRTDISVSRASTSISRMLSERLGTSSLKGYRSQFDVQLNALSPSTLSYTHLKSPTSTFAHCKSRRNKNWKSKSLVESKRHKGLRRTFSLSKLRSLSQRMRPTHVPSAIWVESGENDSIISITTPSSQKLENDSSISVKLPSPREDTPRPSVSQKNPETGI